jgi:hypothetical protein
MIQSQARVAGCRSARDVIRLADDDDLGVILSRYA